MCLDLVKILVFLLLHCFFVCKKKRRKKEQKKLLIQMQTDWTPSRSKCQGRRLARLMGTAVPVRYSRGGGWAGGGGGGGRAAGGWGGGAGPSVFHSAVLSVTLLCPRLAGDLGWNCTYVCSVTMSC